VQGSVHAALADATEGVSGRTGSGSFRKPRRRRRSAVDAGISDCRPVGASVNCRAGTIGKRDGRGVIFGVIADRLPAPDDANRNPVKRLAAFPDTCTEIAGTDVAVIPGSIPD
jgi:hypothetical protein